MLRIRYNIISFRVERSGNRTLFIMQDWAKKFYTSQAWKLTRKAYKKSVGGLCERCREQGIIKPGVIVHHKVWLTPYNIADPHRTLDWDNLQLVCRDCHAEIHKDPKRYDIDENGRVIPRGD